MPTYVYQVIHEDGSEGEVFELVQGMKEPALTVHPETGEPVRRVVVPVHVASKAGFGGGGALSDQNVEKHGFTRYKRTGHGQYEKTAGREGPDSLGV